MERGMSLWYDMIDWLGGLPFEVAKPEQMFEFLHNQGFQMLKFTTVGNRTGCNEIILKKIK
jgi:2-polyprenyl-6-hydroxyphenyl methylase/3-demethylubiquinone-9 3-methyltransferase